MSDYNYLQWRMKIFDKKYECRVRLYKTRKAMVEDYRKAVQEKNDYTENELKEELAKRPKGGPGAVVLTTKDDQSIDMFFCKRLFNINVIAHESLHVIFRFIDRQNIQDIDDDNNPEETMATEIGYLVANIVHNCGKYITP